MVPDLRLGSRYRRDFIKADEKLNLGGYICLKFSLLWGAGCALVVKLLLPLADVLLAIIPRTVGVIAVSILLALMASG